MSDERYEREPEGEEGGREDEQTGAEGEVVAQEGDGQVAVELGGRKRKEVEGGKLPRGEGYYCTDTVWMGRRLMLGVWMVEDAML